MPVSPAPTGKSPEGNPAKRILPAKPLSAAVIALVFTALLYLVELADRILPGNFEQAGIVSRTLSGLDGIAWAPVLHGNWGHLLGNTVPVLVFAFLAMAGGIGRWLLVTAIVWVLGGVGVWLVGPSDAVTIGASGLAFGWLAYLLVRGVFTRSFAQLTVAAVLLFLWGGMLWGVLPGDPHISWQGHLFGALAGVLAAWLTAGRDRRDKSAGALPPPGNLGV
jgi:membrane associated rhomboid family serine protease